MQSRSQIGWNVAIVAVLSISLTGCMESVDTDDYEVILDQPETPPEKSGSELAATATDSGDAASDVKSEDPDTAAPQTPDGSDTKPSGDPKETIAANDTAAANNPESADNQTAQREDAAAEETPVATPTPAEQPTGSNVGQDAKKPSASDVAATEKSGADANAKTAPKVPNVEELKPLKPRVVKLLIPDKKFKVEGPQKSLRVSFDDFDLLKVLNMDPVTEDAPSRMPEWLKELDGKRIRLRGFMYPEFMETGITGFVLARDNEICCFGRDPLVYDLVAVFMRDGVTTNYIENRPFDVVGVFHIGDSITPGRLYSLDDAIVID